MKTVIQKKVCAALLVLILLVNGFVAIPLAAGAEGANPSREIQAWASGIDYVTGQLVTFEGKVYKCVQPHKSQIGWEPNKIQALWTVQENPVGTPTDMSTSTPTNTPTNTPVVTFGEIVTIDAPYYNQHIPGSTTIEIKSTVNYSGTITKVEFYGRDGGTTVQKLIGVDNSYPYSISYQLDNYSKFYYLTAKVYSGDTEVGTSKPVQIYIYAVTQTATPTPTIFVERWYRVSGYVAPDLVYSADAGSKLKSGFKVEVIGALNYSATTDSNGYFSIMYVAGKSTIKVSKENYLMRNLGEYIIDGNTEIGTQAVPLDMWPGDMVIKGLQDEAINMSDIVETIQYFNSSVGDGKYVESYDLDKDGAINMSDILTIIKHFNTSILDYPKAPVVIITPIPSTSTPTPTPSNTPTPSPTIPLNGVSKPFPQNLSFAGCIKPNNVTQDQMNNSIKSYYDYWKAKYVKQSNGTTPGGGFYVEMQGTGGTGNEITTSEAHGYGMIVFALMAGYDKEAKKYFDGMYNMYDKHRSTINRNNMSWIIDRSELTSKDSDSATDGDMDIAYACLLAHYQWGSDGAINYLAEAKRMITNGIKQSDMSLTSKRTMLGDWDTNQYSTRASDWMTGHFKAYKAATGDTFWDDASNTIYSLISQITANYAPNTGLMPDFVVDNPPKPAPPKFLEAETDDDYSWNSCRFPWRIAMDFAHYGTLNSKSACNKMINWLKDATGNSPNSIVAGYKLDGTKLQTYSSAAFTSPFIAACIVDSAHQNYLNNGWNVIQNWRSEYYGDSINLLCMLFISGNWWAPVN
ncbi:MAG: glycosyl hydrolase family 8 [Clostridia bacterium]|nr:glycosyl hydrolase family 8 [Clostridia bacterium]